MPFVIVLSITELVVEFSGNVIHSHAVFDIDLKLLDDNTDFGNVLLSLGKIIDALWWLLDPFNDLIKLRSQIIIFLNSSLSNKFDLLVNNGLVLDQVDVTDVFTVNREDRNYNGVRNSLLKVLLQFTESEDVSSQRFWFRRLVSLIQRLDVLVNIEFVLFLELGKGLNVLVQRLHCFSESFF